MSKRSFLFLLAAYLASSGCLQSRLAAGRGTGYGTLDMTIGMLPVHVSLNPNQNMFPGVAALMDQEGLFKSVEPVAAAPNKQFDLLLVAGTGQFSTELTVKSGYSNKELFKTKVMAFYGKGGRKAIRRIYNAFRVGKPAYQELMAERTVWRRQHGKTKTAQGGITKEDIAEIVKTAVRETAPSKKTVKEIVSDVDKPAYMRPENPDDFAVVVGIEDYSALPDAEFAERDARAVAKHLAAMGFPARNVVTLTGTAASRAGLVKNLETWLPKNVKPDSTVFFYYSGHGAPDVESRKAYLVPWDGDPKFLKDTGYPVGRLYSKLQALPAKRVIVALDACFSGAGGRSVIPKGTRPLIMKVDAGAAGSKLVVFSASDADEITGTEEAQGHGLFTYYFLKGLSGAARNSRGRVTVQGLYKYLAPKVEDEARRNNRAQTPKLMPASLGDRAEMVLNKL